MQPFKKVIFIGAALLLIAALFTTAQADYLGPNRVIVTYETIYQRQACRFVDVRDPAGPGVCACTIPSTLGPRTAAPAAWIAIIFIPMFVDGVQRTPIAPTPVWIPSAGPQAPSRAALWGIRPVPPS